MRTKRKNDINTFIIPNNPNTLILNPLGTNLVRLHVFANEAEGHAVLVALLDNLGKGASGQAVQNMNLMLGLAEDAGLDAASDAPPAAA